MFQRQKTFEFEVKPGGNPDADISELTINGTTIAIDGKGDFAEVLKIAGDAAIITNAGGLKLT